ncbi:hydrogenase/urease nickel incorporation protein HypA [Thiomicrorhabdus sp. ZW0627]|uniref:hydrogenase/urease nickel incorporation protein HypA n=1 Tax=Thiomicrorhabdus sp. ZW0627 TaxID=3039774 RepID=UPI0024370ACB|nr:hydrogenase/urease nickel incorporation protein HypA [Thiomicrorhabdus sp. ZW0627]MDG6774151.1 hydrogenase/urease nickel incorporation protein HypA [Thiomicrorhabdus sp. ZW0627]
MHEYSIVRDLIEQCEHLASDNQATEVSKVVIKIGKLSGVEPDLLATAFDTFREASPVCRTAELDMQIQPVKIFCRGCGEHSTLDEHRYVCPLCQSVEISVTDGEEMFLMQLEMK